MNVFFFFFPFIIGEYLRGDIYIYSKFVDNFKLILKSLVVIESWNLIIRVFIYIYIYIFHKPFVLRTGSGKYTEDDE